MPVARIVAEVRRGSSVLGANVYHFDLPGPDLDGAQGAVDRLGSLYTAIAGFYPGDTETVIGESITTVDTTPGTIIQGVVPEVVDNSGGTTQNPANSAIVCTWRTALTGRSYRGRTYFGPFTNGVTDGTGTTVPTAILDGFQSAIDAFMTAELSDPDANLVVWSTTLGAGTPVSSGQVRNYLASQRGRL